MIESLGALGTQSWRSRYNSFLGRGEYTILFSTIP
jgi:hypothetical protein